METIDIVEVLALIFSNREYQSKECDTMDKILEVKFSNIEEVNKFVRIISKYDADFDLYCGSYSVDAKSILGIMTMDLRNKMWMKSNCDQNDREKIVDELKSIVAA